MANKHEHTLDIIGYRKMHIKMIGKYHNTQLEWSKSRTLRASDVGEDMTQQEMQEFKIIQIIQPVWKTAW